MPSPSQRESGSTRELADDTLVDLCRDQLPYRTEAYEALVARYQRLVLGVCRRYLGSTPDAEEVCQDVFVRVYRFVSGFEKRCSFKSWLMQIAHNLCATQRRKMTRRAHFEVDPEGDLAARNERSAFLKPGPSVADLALNCLSKEDRHVLILRYVADLSIQEVADVLSINLSATKMRLYRAVERFQTAYAEERNRGRDRSGSLERD